jgi:hypothetical protein
MMKELCSYPTGGAEVRRHFRILKHLGKGSQSKLRQGVLHHLLKLQMGSPFLKD